MNLQRGLKRLRIVFSILGFLAGLIIFGIVSYDFWNIPNISQARFETQFEILMLKEAKIIAVPDSNQQIYRYFPNINSDTFVDLDEHSYQQYPKILQITLNELERKLTESWGKWLITTIVGGFVSFVVVWFILKIFSWIILGFVKK